MCNKAAQYTLPRLTRHGEQNEMQKEEMTTTMKGEQKITCMYYMAMQAMFEKKKKKKTCNFEIHFVQF